MSSSTPHFHLQPGSLADLAANAYGHEPAGHVVLMAFGTKLSLFDIEYDKDPNTWPALAADFIGIAAHRLRALGQDPREVVLIIYAHPGDGPEAIEEHTLLGRRLVLACGNHGLPVGGRQFATPTHWWSLPGFMPSDGPGLGSVRLRGAALAQAAAASSPAGADAGLMDQAYLDFTDELSARGRDDMLQLLLLFVVDLLADGQDLQELADQQLARLVFAAQSGAFRHLAALRFEPQEVKRARRLWQRVADLCTGEHAQLAGGPLVLLGIAALLDGDCEAASGHLGRAVEAKPEAEDARAALLCAEFALIAQRFGVPLDVPGELRRHLSGD
ncbi:DUF4192 family protein [Kitasatospora cineracea]|uniref:Uncharacterized protein DUF4192 n=1 Tax=Kitasatospora cineracea TaxID=88074 RepID=A0A8G1UFE6_9ACTN|nr:DUF4192 family protein [Kitasatospora cineracea]ROR42912.1 uncharacterized protein DUF4192 [Kitasatospora cineracea]